RCRYSCCKASRAPDTAQRRRSLFPPDQQYAPIRANDLCVLRLLLGPYAEFPENASIVATITCIQVKRTQNGEPIDSKMVMQCPRSIGVRSSSTRPGPGLHRRPATTDSLRGKAA